MSDRRADAGTSGTGRGAAGPAQGAGAIGPHVWVDTPEALREAAGRLAGARALAVDTEADSFYHYQHKCCLVQVSDGEVVYLVDPLALRDLGPLREVLGSPAILKVLHAAEQDVLYLRRDHDISLVPLFDTMIAAQLLGRDGIGLARLLEVHYGVRLDKGCQRDDWSRRPLTERQQIYAAEDVRHLIRLSDLLRADLEARERLEWAEEEFGLVARRAWEPRTPDPNAFWSIKGSRDLAPREAAVLRALHALREQRAMAADVPPFRILSDETLLALARRRPARLHEMQGIRGVTPLVRRRIGDDVLEAVRVADLIPEADLPVPPRGIGRRKTAAMQARLERLREWRKERAAALAMDPGVLFPLATLEGIAIGGLPALDAPDTVPGLRRWRRELILPDAPRLLA
jgi:ribonuclease D